MSTFLPWKIETRSGSMLERLESEVLDTVKGLTSLLADFPPSVRLVVWLNEFFGPIVNAQGKPFEEMPAYTDVSP